MIIDFYESTNTYQNQEIFDNQPKLVSNNLEQLPACQFLFYVSEQTGARIEVVIGNETIWAKQQGLAKNFV